MKTWFIVLLLIGKGNKSMDYLEYLQKCTVSNNPVIQAAFEYQVSSLRGDSGEEKQAYYEVIG